ncbi:hypothetical protein N7G274_009364 [Stereocaulon virgatum]|uniref:F-box domain-containing protein n=1 Tax=Stereocaulon virgatum TaxID=373712 RepID=A0ABR3ZW90_9LECA
MMSSTTRPAATKGSRCTLPPEIWTMIFQEVHGTNCLEKMVWLWTEGRHVSKYFMSIIEELFRTVYLPEARIRFYLDRHSEVADEFEFVVDAWEKASHEAFQSRILDATDPSDYDFHLLDFLDEGDHSKAIFSIDKPLMKSTRRDDLIFRRLWERTRLGDTPIGIQVCQAINDTQLPDLRIDQQLQTLSFCWRGMFTKLLGEEKAAIATWNSWQRYFGSWLASRPAWTTSVDASNDFCEAMLTWAKSRSLHYCPNPGIPGFNGAMGTCQVIARRGRLRRQSRALFGTTIVDDYIANNRPYPRRYARRWDDSRYPPSRFAVNSDEHVIEHESRDVGVSAPMTCHSSAKY